MTETLYSTDAYANDVDARVVKVDPDTGAVVLDRTVFYPGGGGQPCDIGTLAIGDDQLAVSKAKFADGEVWHWLSDERGDFPAALRAGTQVRATIDWNRRYRIMRTHTAMHAMCGVMWNHFNEPVTGSDMDAGKGRLDYPIPDWDPDLKPVLEQKLNDELQKELPVEVSFLPREEADLDPSLIRTKVSLLPKHLTEVRVIEIKSLDRQADGGTHVRSTAEVGRVELVKVDNKGKGFRRFRIALAADDA